MVRIGPLVLVAMLLCPPAGTPAWGTQNGFLPFLWSHERSGDFHSEKAALLVPVYVVGDQRTFYLQLDTGCEGTFVYGDVLLRLAIAVDSGAADILLDWYPADSKFGISKLPIWWRENVTPDSSDPGPAVIGTLGSGFLDGRVLVLDYPNCRYAIYAYWDDIPQIITAGIDLIPAEVRDHKFYVSVMLDQDTVNSVLFDTGTSDFTLVLPQAEWGRHTGLEGNEPIVQRDSVPSWGKNIPVWRAPSIHPLHFGRITMDRPSIACVGPGQSSNALRLMGNALFYDDYTLVVDFQGSRLGILRTRSEH
jgi:hypothetical protein